MNQEQMHMSAMTPQSSKTVRKIRPNSISASPEQRCQMIEQAAYFRAEKRGFQGGDPVADWLLAETQIDALLSSTGGNETAR
jgi:hypothetical protein